ncbi:MAG TPA: EamA family transporter [Candidatus Ozemobacteraceae bacterium]|nr:EamA family transporter [Candidatus Ozemobacteraceae bacterium]
MPPLQLAAFLLFTIVAFSSIEVVSHPIRDQIDPMLLTFWRFHLGGLCLLILGSAFGDFRRHVPPQRSDWLQLTLLGALNVILSMGALAVAIKYASASTVAILISSNPLATNVFARLLLAEPLDTRRWIALLCGVTGVVLICLRPTGTIDTAFGIGCGLAAMLTFGLYTVVSKPLVARLGSLPVAAYSFGLACLIYFPFLWVHLPTVWPANELWGRILYLGIVVSGLAYVTFYRALAVLPAGRASLLFFCKPPTAGLLAWLVLGETPGQTVLIGAGLVMFGLLIDRRPSSESRR